MKKTLLLLIIVPLLMGAGCASKSIQENENQEVNINKTAELEKTKEITKNKNTDTREYDYVLYENKAIGYSIMRPDGWYWQHFMKNEIVKAERDELIDDYLVLDKNSLTGLSSEYLGQIVIEKSTASLEALAMHNKEYASKKVTIAGQDATRFELKTDSTLIEYHFKNGNATFRLIYNSDNGNEAVFEKIVKSFSFGNTSSEEITINKYYCDTAEDCVPDTSCHPTEYVNKQFGPDDALAPCTASCDGPIDCGAGHAECQSNKCVVVPGAK